MQLKIVQVIFCDKIVKIIISGADRTQVKTCATHYNYCEKRIALLIGRQSVYWCVLTKKAYNTHNTTNICADRGKWKCSHASARFKNDLVEKKSA